MFNKRKVFDDAQLAQNIIDCNGYSYNFAQKIYSFTTENIGGYINSFDLFKNRF